MNHLTDEQFESVLQGEETDLAHLKQCQDCRDRLAEKQSVARRLRCAFNSVQPGQDLAEKIRSRLKAKSAPKVAVQPTQRSWAGHRIRHLWPALAAAAAVLIVLLVPLSLYFVAPSAAEAAQRQLVDIHNHNLSANHEFHSEAEPEKLAEYFKSKLGFSLRLPEPGRGLALRGCCVKHFRGKVVGSYVVDTPQGVMSVVVVTDKPESLGMAGGKFKKGAHTYWKSTFAMCDMVSVRIGDYSYCAVGVVSHEYLTDLLSRLVPKEQE